MTKTFEAVFAGGVIKPVVPVEGLEENERLNVTVTLSTAAANTSPATTANSGHPFADWVGGVSDEDAARMRAVVDEEFGRVDPDDWK